MALDRDSLFRIALAAVVSPQTADESIEIVVSSIHAAADGGAKIVCFPECIVPGYRTSGDVPAPDQEFLDMAWAACDAAAAQCGIAVILGTERVVKQVESRITARVTNADGTLGGFQDKVQLDPSEESTFTAGSGRKVFECDELTFGVVICHEGWRYPETVRSAVRSGAQVVFHPHFEIVEDTGFQPTSYGDPANTFHEKAALARAAENTCYFATVNCALDGATTTSAIIAPDGQLICYQPYGQDGILFADIDLSLATGCFAKRLRRSEYAEVLSS